MKICSIAFIDDVLGKGSEIEENENSDLPQKNAHLYILVFGAVSVFILVLVSRKLE